MRRATHGRRDPIAVRIVSAIAGGHPAVALLVGGGDGTRVEVIEHLLRHRPIVVLGGSGRLADTVAQGLASSSDTDLRALLTTGHIRVVDTSRSPSELGETLSSLLAPGHTSPRRDRWAVLSVLPRLRLRPQPPGPLLGPRADDRYPALRMRIDEADRIVFPAFAALDMTARAEQNRYRWFTTLALMGGLLTTMFGALQAWLSSQRWPGVVVATVGAATSALTTVARRQGSLQTYLTAHSCRTAPLALLRASRQAARDRRRHGHRRRSRDSRRPASIRTGGAVTSDWRSELLDAYRRHRIDDQTHYYASVRRVRAGGRWTVTASAGLLVFGRAGGAVGAATASTAAMWAFMAAARGGGVG